MAPSASPAASESTTSSVAHWEQAKQWISQCQEHHSLCGKSLGADLSLPTRLLHVEKPTDPTGTPKLRLVTTSEHMALYGTSPPYLALSHSWGTQVGTQVPLTLKTSNLQEFCETDGIPVEHMSQNMQDALRVVLGLGYAYLWIDSLCIIQDDSADWARESQKMADVYAGAICTIAATASTSGDGGCFRTREPSALRIYQISGEEEDEGVEHENLEEEASSGYNDSKGVISLRFDDGFDFERHVDRSPINHRGWVFQERLLSPRILHFGERMLYWECWQRSASEVFPHGYVYKRYPDDFVDDYAPRITWISSRQQLEEAESDGRGLYWSYQQGIRDRPPAPADDPDDLLPWDRNRKNRKFTQRGQTSRFWHDIRKASSNSWRCDETEASGFRDSFWRLLMVHHSDNEVGPESFTHIWYQLVQTYSRGQLTFASDKLVAFSAVVNTLQRKHRYTYLAGLWREHLLPGLLWVAQEGSASRRLTMVWPKNANPDQNRTYVAPTWTWASLEGVIDIHLVPENARYKIRMSRALATVENVTITSLSGSDMSSAPLQGTLVIDGPMFPVTKIPAPDIRYRKKIWLDTGGNRPVWAWFMPDADEKVDDCDFFCLSLLELETSTCFDDDDDEPSWEIQGLFLSRKRESEVFQRRGLFFVHKEHSNDKARQALGNKDRVTVTIV
ncbi:hypothetical protein IL306_007201 [Fusarium sp. DS 682]|nr:hypothetical protein IL306_007201 [Fusarium sp. DS 682]